MAPLVLTAGAGTGDVPAEDLAAVREMVVGYQVSQIVYAACELRVIDHIANGVHDLARLAAHTATPVHNLELLLDCLAGLGLLIAEGGGRYRLTARGGLLDSRRPDGLRPTIVATGQHRYGPWGDLLNSLRTGSSAFTRQHGQRLHDFYAANPAAAAPFNAAMAALTAQNIDALAAAYPFGRHRLVIDVGGNLGVLMTAILTAHPRLHGVVFDLPHVAAQAARRLAEHGLTERCQAIGGDARHEVPAEADCYLFKMVLCDFGDLDATAMLRAVRRAIADDGSLVIIDKLRRPPHPEDATPLGTTMSALNLLVMTGSLERSHAEYRQLLDATGFAVTDTQRTNALGGELYLLHARPA
jgi:orsellinic acid C2-O-methyltransferase